MRKLATILCALALTSACATVPTSVPAPVTVANLTKADEQAVVTAENAYKTFRLAVETGVNAGLIKGQLAGTIAAVDNRAYSALQAAEHAYESGNAADLATALVEFNAAIVSGAAAIKGK